MPQVRIGDCGCILLADVLPVGYRFKLTTLGDVRTPVYACEMHDRTKGLRVYQGDSDSTEKSLTPGGSGRGPDWGRESPQ
jgi:hypothetical protein